MQLLDNLKEARRYWNFKEETLYRTLWRTRFGKDGLVVNQCVMIMMTIIIIIIIMQPWLIVLWFPTSSYLCSLVLTYGSAYLIQ
jgi:hypothetical protein